MYRDRIEITNPGGLYGTNKLEKLDSASLMETRNPNIVRILVEKGNAIENRHTGISTMKREMKKYNLPEPEFYEENSFFRVTFRNAFSSSSDTQHLSGHQSGHQILGIEEYKNNILKYCQKPKSAKEIREFLQIKSRQYISSKIIQPLIEEGKLEYTNQNNIRAKDQKYITKK